MMTTPPRDRAPLDLVALATGRLTDMQPNTGDRSRKDASVSEQKMSSADLTPEQKEILRGQGLYDPYMAVLDELRELTLKKRAGYSPGEDPFANFRMTTMFKVPCECGCGHATPIPPIFGIMIREMDKLSRIASLLADPDNDKVGESLRDNSMDAGNYPLIAVAMMDADTPTRVFDWIPDDESPECMCEDCQRPTEFTEPEAVVKRCWYCQDMYDNDAPCGCRRPCPDCTTFDCVCKTEE